MNNQFQTEQSVLGSLIKLSDLNCDQAQKAFGMLTPGSFSDGRNREIFKALQVLERQETFADLITVNNAIERSGRLESIGGIAYVVDVIQSAPSAANLLSYADSVRQSAIKRTVNSEIQQALADFNESDGENIYQKIGHLETLLSALGQRAATGRISGLTHIKEIGKKWFSEFESRQADPESHAGLSTGIASLDAVLGPKLVVAGSLFVVGARPKMGKTAFLEAMAKSSGNRPDKLTAIFSLEMPDQQLYERFLTSESKVNSDKFYTANLTDYEWQSASTAIGKINKTNIFIDDTPSITIQHIKKECRKLAKTAPISMIAVDYLTLMKAGKADRNDLAYGDITKELKALAKELDCVVLLLTQLNRNLEQRAEKRPIPADSRDTGQIEQDADYWVGLYREAVYNEDLPPDQRGLTEALVRLNRHGGIGTGYMNLTAGYFTDHPKFTFEKPAKNNSRNF